MNDHLFARAETSLSMMLGPWINISDRDSRQPAGAHRSKGRCRRGFTLLEIMVALAIISIALVSLLSLGNRSIGVHDRLQRVTQATLLAQHKMAETEVTAPQNLQRTNEEGVFEAPYELYRWRLEYSETPLPSITMVTVTVSWGNEEENEAVSIDSFVF